MLPLAYVSITNLPVKREREKKEKKIKLKILLYFHKAIKGKRKRTRGVVRQR